jgi:hypothetical protein
VEIDDVIARGMAKEPADRHPSAGELIAEAKQALGTAPSSIKPLPAPMRSTVPTRFAAEDPTAQLGEAARGRHWRLGVLAAVAATGAVAALIGVLAGGATATHARSSRQAGPIALDVPAGWRPTGRSPLPGVSGSRTLVLTHEGDPAGDTLVAANLRHTGPRLLPNAFVKTLPSVPTRPDPVRLGSSVAQRYPGLKPRGRGLRVTAYVVPNSAGVATLACTATVASAPAFLPRCEKVVGTLALHGVTAQSLAPSAKYARQLGAVSGGLNRDRNKGRARLRAKRPADQARAAGMLASGFAAAARRMGKIHAPAAAARAHALVVSGSRRASRAYTRMRSAVRGGRRGRYRAAVRDAKAAEATVQRGFASLRPLGYSVR